MQRSRLILGSCLVLFGLGLRFAADVRAQSAETKPGATVPAQAHVDGGVSDPAPSADAATAPSADAADSGASATSPAAAESPSPPVAEEAPSSGSGLFEASLSGAPAAEGEKPTEVAEAHGFDLGGYVRGDMFLGKIPKVAQPEAKAAYGELALKLNVKKEKYGDAFAEARLRYGLQGNESDLYLDLREAYVNAYLGPVDIRLGQQIIVWGRADAFNPTNNITPFDLRIRSPVEDDRRLGNVGVRTFVNFEPMRLEGVWMPIYRPAELPSGISPEVVTFAEPTFPDPGLQRSLGALRAHLELPAFETSVSYLYGYAPLPGFALAELVTGADPEIRVTRVAYNQHVLGFDFSTAFGEAFALRGEAAYRRPLHWQTRPFAPHPDIQYVLGADRTFGSVNVIAQYMGRYVFFWELEQGSSQPLNLNALRLAGDPPSPLLYEPIVVAVNQELAQQNQIVFSQRAEVQHLATVRIEWLTLHDTLSVSALGMANFTTEEWLFFPKLGYKVSDAMSTSFGAEIYGGPDDTLFGLIDAELSAAYAELRFSF